MYIIKIFNSLSKKINDYYLLLLIYINKLHVCMCVCVCV